ncbi:hypothetical protein MPLSOD_140663 [Mesorhizobium sp. SOD10]|nr:hypothetical protein MPLSOD_140663 [Mesorhizobium sp. SOD10]
MSASMSFSRLGLVEEIARASIGPPLKLTPEGAIDCDDNGLSLSTFTLEEFSYKAK